METKLLSTSEQDLKTAAGILHSGGLVAIPTETVYGLGANGLDPEAVAKIFAAKGRPQDNPLILHIAEAGQLSDYCRDIPATAWKLAERFWPGPLTMVLPVRDLVPKTTTANLDTVAMRCPQTPATREIIRLAGVPVAAPSANLSGKPSTTTAAHVLHDMDGKIDAIVDGGPCRVGVESTIVDLTGEKPRLLRPGGVTPEQLLEVLGELEIDKAVTAQIANDTVVRAPGMKYKHYAPDAEVVIVAGSRENAAAWIRRNFSSGSAVLCFEEELPLYEGLAVTAYGREAAPETLSAGLFAALRALDRPDVTRIFARCPEGGGIAYAVQNRLRKSAGFCVVNADDRDQGSVADGSPVPSRDQGSGIRDQGSVADGSPVPSRDQGSGIKDQGSVADGSPVPSRDQGSGIRDQGRSGRVPRPYGGGEKPVIFGITGPSGAGKTTALEVLESLGARVFDCDAIYHELLRSDAALLTAIAEAFPGTVRGGALDRKALGAIVFADPAALQKLNAVTHPFVKRELLQRLGCRDGNLPSAGERCSPLQRGGPSDRRDGNLPSAGEQCSPLQRGGPSDRRDGNLPSAGEQCSPLQLAAIDAIGLFEGGLAELCDVTVAVVAPEEARLARLMARDGIDEPAARARMRAQRSAEEFEQLCDITLRNDSTEDAFREQCKKAFSEWKVES